MNGEHGNYPEFRPKTDFFIGFDSDGCVFDSMELKHKECFCPAFIRRFSLQQVSRFARETWEYVNLYSKTRGANRFIALVRALEILSARPETMERGVHVPLLPALSEWISRTDNLSNASLEREIGRNPNPDLLASLAWSKDVDASVALTVKGLRPFPGVLEILRSLRGRADVMVVSQTPEEAIRREWAEGGIACFVDAVAGQERGTKTRQLSGAAGTGYRRGHVLLVGDAPGDAEAAGGAGALFFPIIPLREEESWDRFLKEALPRFFSDTFSGSYERFLRAEFDSSLA